MKSIISTFLALSILLVSHSAFALRSGWNVRKEQVIKRKGKRNRVRFIETGLTIDPHYHRYIRSSGKWRKIIDLRTGKVYRVWHKAITRTDRRQAFTNIRQARQAIRTPKKAALPVRTLDKDSHKIRRGYNIRSTPQGQSIASTNNKDFQLTGLTKRDYKGREWAQVKDSSGRKGYVFGSGLEKISNPIADSSLPIKKDFANDGIKLSTNTKKGNPLFHKASIDSSSRGLENLNAPDLPIMKASLGGQGEEKNTETPIGGGEKDFMSNPDFGKVAGDIKNGVKVAEVTDIPLPSRKPVPVPQRKDPAWDNEATDFSSASDDDMTVDENSDFAKEFMCAARAMRVPRRAVVKARLKNGRIGKKAVYPLKRAKLFAKAYQKFFSKMKKAPSKTFRRHLYAQQFQETGSLKWLEELPSKYASSRKKHRGRGGIQITHKGNYAKFASFFARYKKSSGKFTVRELTSGGKNYNSLEVRNPGRAFNENTKDGIERNALAGVWYLLDHARRFKLLRKALNSKYKREKDYWVSAKIVGQAINRGPGAMRIKGGKMPLHNGTRWRNFLKIGSCFK